MNPLMQVHLHAGSTVNGSFNNAIGVNYPKGFILVIGGFSFSKDGIANLLDDWSLGTAIIARLVGILDTVLTAISFPFMVLTYLITFILGVISWVLLWPFFLCSSSGSVFNTYMITIGIFIPTSILALMAGIILLGLTPFQIVIPELTCYVLHVHEWGWQEPL